jgi:hypothetical protein
VHQLEGEREGHADSPVTSSHSASSEAVTKVRNAGIKMDDRERSKSRTSGLTNIETHSGVTFSLPAE